MYEWVKLFIFFYHCACCSLRQLPLCCYRRIVVNPVRCSSNPFPHGRSPESIPTQPCCQYPYAQRSMIPSLSSPNAQILIGTIDTSSRGSEVISVKSPNYRHKRGCPFFSSISHTARFVRKTHWRLPKEGVKIAGFTSGR